MSLWNHQRNTFWIDGLVFQRTLFTFSVRILIYIHDMKPLCHRLIDNIFILLDLDHIAWFGCSERFFIWIILFPLIFMIGVPKNVCWRVFRARNLKFWAIKKLFCPQVGIFGYYPLLSGIFVGLNLDRIQPALLSHSAGYWWPAHHAWWWYSPVATCLMDLRPRIFVMLPCLQFSLLGPNKATTQWVIPARSTLRSAPIYFLFAPLLRYPELVVFLALNENDGLELYVLLREVAC